MSEDKEKLTIEEAEESEAAKSAEKVEATEENARGNDFIPDMDPEDAASLADMDPEEAAVVARVLARMMVKAENAASGAAEADAETKTEAAADATSEAEAKVAADSADKAESGKSKGTSQPETADASAKVPDSAPADAPAEVPDSAPADAPAEPPTLHHVLTEEELLAAEAAEQAEKKTFKGKSKSALKRLISVATPDNKKLAIPAIIAEFLALSALIIILGRYSHVAPPTPTEYADDRHTDVIKCLDGELIVNGVTAKVPSEGNVNYGISYVWAEDDTDYPSVPHAIIASYRADPAPADSGEQASEQADDQSGDKVVSSDELKKDAKDSSDKDAEASDSKDAEAASGEEASEENAEAASGEEASEENAEAASGENAGDASKDDSENAAADDSDSKNDKDSAADSSGSNADADKEKTEDEAEEKAAENAEVLYEISLYKDSFTAKKDIPKGKNYKNWFSDWTEEKSEDSYKFAHRVGNTRGFIVSTLNSKNAPEDYRTYTYYFTVPENNGIALYVLEGTCYDPESRKKFTTIIKNAINSIEVNIEET